MPRAVWTNRYEFTRRRKGEYSQQGDHGCWPSQGYRMVGGWTGLKGQSGWSRAILHHMSATLFLPSKVWGRACVRSCFAPVTRRRPSAWPLPSLTKASSHRAHKSARATSCPARTACLGGLRLPPLAPALRRTARRPCPTQRAQGEPEDFWGSHLVLWGPGDNMAPERPLEKATSILRTRFFPLLSSLRLHLCPPLCSAGAQRDKSGRAPRIGMHVSSHRNVSVLQCTLGAQ